jgi:pimeloyl-ACP methyl ester carboxylesterase
MGGARDGADGASRRPARHRGACRRAAPSVLILHSDDDGFVPPAHARLAAARPDLVELQVFRTARHTKLWNYDQQRWTDAIGGLAAPHTIWCPRGRRGER